MSGAEQAVANATPPAAAGKSSGRLFRKYVTFFVAVVCVALVSNGAFEFWFYYREYQSLLVRLQQAEATAAAGKISQFFKEIESQMGWTTQLPWEANSVEEWRFDIVRLMRQVPAITEIAKIDASGHEGLRVSRLAPDTVGSQVDHSRDPAFIEVMAKKLYYGPVSFRRESEPYLSLAMAGDRAAAGATIAEVNLKFIWDVVTQIKVGVNGRAYVVDQRGRLIAHPDLSLVLRNTDLSQRAQVQAAWAANLEGQTQESTIYRDLQGREVLTAYAPIAPLGWLVFIELPVPEGYSLLYASMLTSGIIFVAALALAALAGLLLARRMIVPIRMLSTGAAQIGAGDLSQRISITTGDELQALGEQFNRMASQIEDATANLERKVEERTHDLALANLAKSRFLAAASHDLRQPLHALGLFVSQLRGHIASAEGGKLLGQVDASVAAMNELFNALLDISRLDAGVLPTEVVNFPISRLLKRIENTFAGAAKEKGLTFRIIQCGAWVRSDAILLERAILNLASNAVRYTSHGGVVVGCRRRSGELRIEVYDTGPGIPEGQRRSIFAEFYQLPASKNRATGGLGLGLSIVDRLCNLLGHPVELESEVRHGSRFTVVVPQVAAQAEAPSPPPVMAPAMVETGPGKLVVVVDDDSLVLDGMGGLLRSWGCKVVAANSLEGALSGLAAHRKPPDLIISDYHLTDGHTGFDVIDRLRSVAARNVPAFLISGDTAPEQLRRARAVGHHLLLKPVSPMTLRAMFNRLLKLQPVSEKMG